MVTTNGFALNQAKRLQSYFFYKSSRQKRLSKSCRKEDSLLGSSPELVIARIHSCLVLCKPFHNPFFLITCVLIAVRQEVNNLESPVVVQGFELATYLALYVFMKPR